MNKKQNYIFNGKLEYNDDALYEIHSPGGVVHNISRLLNKVYLADNNYIEFKIMDGCKTIFSELGNLKFKNNPDNGLYDYYIDVYNLEEVLFNHTGEFLEITVYTGALIEQGDISYDRKQIAK